jgi:hypothetical protein
MYADWPLLLLGLLEIKFDMNLVYMGTERTVARGWTINCKGTG